MVQRRDASQVVTYAPDGSDPRWLGAVGHVTALRHSFTFPGGCDQLSWLLQVPPTDRVPAVNPGRLARVYRGASVAWNGTLDEPQPATEGWSCTAHGSGTWGTQFCDIWTTWNNPDEHINAAIARGLGWRNPGITGTSGLWLGDQVDSGSQTIADFLTSVTVQGALAWTIDRRSNSLAIAPLPTAVTRLLVATSPVARTVAGDVNSLFLRYQATGDTQATSTVSAAAATYAGVNVVNAGDIALHGTTEEYYDLSANGVMTAAFVEANGNAALARFGRANFAGPFTVGPGQLLTTGGVPVDLGAEQAGSVCRLLCTDLGYGGEVTAAPVTFIVGAYEYDDTSQTAQVTPFQNVANDMSGLLAAIFPTVATVA